MLLWTYFTQICVFLIISLEQILKMELSGQE